MCTIVHGSCLGEGRGREGRRGEGYGGEGGAEEGEGCGVLVEGVDEGRGAKPKISTSSSEVKVPSY